MHVFRWDLDKTYLDTDIDSVRGLLRAAVEPARDKRNVPGSAALLRALQEANAEARVVILSGSPEQMRPVIEEKLALDGIRFERLILKDSLGHLKRGRLSAVRGQVGYKLPHLLAERVGLGPAVRETLFGDDTEADAAIYALYADILAGRAGRDELTRVLEAVGAYPDRVRAAVASLDRLGRGDAVEDIFIRMQPRVAPAAFDLLGGRVTPVFSWFQAAFLLFGRARLDAQGAGDVARACAGDPRELAAWIADLVRRGHVDADRALDLVDRAPALARARAGLERMLARMGPPRRAPRGGVPDYLRFLRAVGGR